jgi:hypothetical protein
MFHNSGAIQLTGSLPNDIVVPWFESSAMYALTMLVVQRVSLGIFGPRLNSNVMRNSK